MYDVFNTKCSIDTTILLKLVLCTQQNPNDHHIMIPWSTERRFIYRTKKNHI